MWDSAYQNPLGFDQKQDTQIPDAQEQAFLDAARERYEYCLKMAKVFKSKEGQEVLATWRKNTIEAPAWNIHTGRDRDERCDHAFAREGQNAFVRDIEMCIEIAHKCKTLDDFCAMINQFGTGNPT
ncbi:MAG: hypothetical protein ACPGQQ_04200 [Candidatus Puniceispirillaceae bacterium]